MTITRDVKHIDIIFENCSFCRISPQDIAWMNCGPIHKSIHCCAGALYDYDETDALTMILKPSANVLYDEYEIPSEKKVMLFDRLMHPNIAAIELMYDESSIGKEIFVPWSDKDEYQNYYETVELLDDGALKIEIRSRDDEGKEVSTNEV